ncbi:MAG TPA: sulfatase [Candidatus Paceibacterota bacterium]|nr:sulfatase [Candidatus Paceibacterota bacterium]
MIKLDYTNNKMKNIVIAVIDSLRCKDLSLYGCEKNNDKNLKEFAKDGVLFKQHFSCSNFSFPSMLSLFTGKYPNNHGLIHQFPYSKPEEIEKFKQNKFWFPSYLRKKGYYTACIGFLGLWLKKGFDFYQEDTFHEEEQSKLRRILNYKIIRKILLSLPGWIYDLGKKITKKRSSIPIPPAKEAIDLAISKIGHSKKLKKPFFLFLHFDNTHFPYPTVQNPKSSGKNDKKTILKSIKAKSQKEYVKKRFVDISLNSIDDIKNKSHSAIKEVDEQLGRFMDFLKKQKLWKNTIFIVLADHGLSVDEHGIYFSSAGLFDETIHVPLIMKIPGIERKEIDEIVQNIEIIPTILDFLKMEKPKNIDGISMLKMVKTKNKNINPIRDRVFAFDGLAEDIKAVRTKKRKLIVAKNNLCYLCKSGHHKEKEEYDLEEDPGELKNIYSKSSKLEKFLKNK